MIDLKQMFEEMLRQKQHCDELEKTLQACREQLDACIRNYMDTVEHLPNPNESYEKFFIELERIIDGGLAREEVQPTPIKRW